MKDLIDTNAQEIADWCSRTAAQWQALLPDDEPDDDDDGGLCLFDEVEVEPAQIRDLVAQLNQFAWMMIQHAASVRRRAERKSRSPNSHRRGRRDAE